MGEIAKAEDVGFAALESFFKYFKVRAKLMTKVRLLDTFGSDGISVSSIPQWRTFNIVS